jgi:hypothetical protein
VADGRTGIKVGGDPYPPPSTVKRTADREVREIRREIERIKHPPPIEPTQTR